MLAVVHFYHFCGCICAAVVFIHGLCRRPLAGSWCLLVADLCCYSFLHNIFCDKHSIDWIKSPSLFSHTPIQFTNKHTHTYNSHIQTKNNKLTQHTISNEIYKHLKRLRSFMLLNYCIIFSILQSFGHARQLSGFRLVFCFNLFSLNRDQ